MIGPLIVALLIGGPPGFVSRPALAQRTAVITLKPVSVYCANDDPAWTAAATSDAQTGHDALAYVDDIGGSQIFLSPEVCRPLLAKINGRPVSVLVFGAALEVLAHEAEHIAGSADEGETECAALAAVPSFARSQFGIKRSSTMRIVIAGAQRRHQRAIDYSSAYAGPCD